MLDLVAAYAANPLDPQWLMDTLGLTEAARTTYRRLSGGQQQRLALACAVVGRPELVFLDEPTAGMDAHARIVVWELIDALRRDGVTVVLTTHQLTEAEELADRLVIIDHGVAVATGTPAELMRSGAENQLRFTRPRMLDLSLLVSALPEGYRATETAPGEYLVEGHIDPQVLATVTAWCARLDVLATDMRVEQRSLEDVFLELTGRELADDDGAIVSRQGTFTPDPRPATVPKMLAAQFGLELKLLLRNGEQLLLTMFIPITLLVGLTLLPLGSFGPNRAATFVPGDHGAGGDLDRVHRAGHRGGVRPPLRRAETTRRDRAAGVGHHRRQVAGGGHRGVPAVDPVGRHRVCAGLAAAHRRAGARRGRSSRSAPRSSPRWDCCSAARCAPRSCWRWPTCCGSSSPALGALTLEGGMVPAAVQWVARLTPSGALTEALSQAMTLSVDWFGLAVLAVWGAVAALCALRWFRFT